MTALIAGSFVSPAAFAKTNPGARMSKSQAGHVRVAKAAGPQMKLQKPTAPASGSEAKKPAKKAKKDLVRKSNTKASSKKLSQRAPRKRVAQTKVQRPIRGHQAGNTKSRHSKRKITKA